MKILFVIKTLTMPGGGAERVLVSIAKNLTERGHDISIASFDHHESKPFYPLDPRVRYYPLDVGEAHRRTQFDELIARIRLLRETARKVCPDVAVGFMHSAYVPLAFSLLGIAIPVLASEHTVFEHYRDRPFDRAMLRLAKYAFKGMTAVSETARATFPRSISSKMQILRNPLWAPSMQADPVGGSRKIILSVGRLGPEKDHATLIEAFARVAAEFPHWTLRIVGEGELRPNLETQVRKLGLEGRILLPGAVADVTSEFAAAQLFVISSRYESFGLVTAEAMAHGLPAIGFADCPGSNERIQDGVDGLLVEGSDRISDLAEAMAALMRSASKRKEMGARARKSITSDDNHVIMAEWEAFLGSATKTPYSP